MLIDQTAFNITHHHHHGTPASGLSRFIRARIQLHLQKWKRTCIRMYLHRWFMLWRMKISRAAPEASQRTHAWARYKHKRECSAYYSVKIGRWKGYVGWISSWKDARCRTRGGMMSSVVQLPKREGEERGRYRILIYWFTSAIVRHFTAAIGRPFEFLDLHTLRNCAAWMARRWPAGAITDYFWASHSLPLFLPIKYLCIVVSTCSESTIHCCLLTARFDQ